MGIESFTTYFVNCEVINCNDVIIGDSLDDVNQELKEMEWTVVDSKYYCPECAKKMGLKS